MTPYEPISLSPRPQQLHYHCTYQGFRSISDNITLFFFHDINDIFELTLVCVLKHVQRKATNSRCRLNEHISSLDSNQNTRNDHVKLCH